MRPLALAVVLLAGCAGHRGTAGSGDQPAQLTSLSEVSRLVTPEGRPRWIHFWALWCSACMEELPRQVAWARQLRAAGVDVVFVDADGFAKADQVWAELERTGAADVAESALLDLSLDANDVTPLLSRDWQGLLPATFARRADGSSAGQVLGPASAEDFLRLTRAIPLQLPGNPSQGDKP